MPTFSIGADDFLLDGQPFRILSGALHYFRVHPEQWADRIAKAKLMGLNTIETYVAWNQHSPERGVFDTTGTNDLERFLDLIAEAGMYAIVRPGPYICAEWDNGGLPGWLLHDPELGLRRSEPRYLAAVREYFEALLPIVAARQIDRGGPVILVQVENEYGAYGDDHDYLRTLTAWTRELGITVPLTTVDQPTAQMLEDGSIPELHKTGSFGSRSLERLATLREHQPTGPLMCSEFWDGWFDHWGEHHHTTPVAETAADLDALLATGASVNIYMFHGGTNFGFTGGANDKGQYRSHVTSYDYDAPLDEAGHPTEKFFAFRDVIAKYAEVPTDIPPAAADAPAFTAAFESEVPFAQVADELAPLEAFDRIPTMDELGAFSGLARYRARLGGRGGVLRFAEVRDRVVVSVDGVPVGTLTREFQERSLVIPAGETLELLLENQGRVNYGRRLGEPKGIIGPVSLDGVELTAWGIAPIALDRLDEVVDAAASRTPVAPISGAGPVLLTATVTLDAPTDLFLDTAAWGKGLVWVNGFLLGRYWSRGPQHTLYVPGGQLRAGANRFTVFEFHALTAPELSFLARPSLGPVEF
ncbi:beta-galactosidase [Plantibacter sp. Leaf314]|uniref:glycoside hydrolase family 35 protein n=1 Tax=Plantibacter sp. Leaf314 TaxID=1736333 RepID=UPI0006FE49DE|nr:beta-galactosidase [Plantibacter sp. Leaf314]KQQ49749.1 beta-galactosidase [Plantibacter sp. Leaf314]